MPPFTMSFSWMTPSTAAPSATTSGVAALPAIRSPMARTPAGNGAAVARSRRPRSRRRRPCGPGGRRGSTPLMRVCAVKGTNVAPSVSHVALAEPVLLLRQDDDAAALRASRRRATRAGRRRRARARSTPVGREEGGRLAVAERDRAGLVEQQHVDVARRLDRAARHGDDVRLDHAVHAGDADRREQRRRWWSGSGRRAARRAP